MKVPICHRVCHEKVAGITTQLPGVLSSAIWWSRERESRQLGQLSWHHRVTPYWLERVLCRLSRRIWRFSHQILQYFSDCVWPQSYSHLLCWSYGQHACLHLRICCVTDSEKAVLWCAWCQPANGHCICITGSELSPACSEKQWWWSIWRYSEGCQRSRWFGGPHRDSHMLSKCVSKWSLALSGKRLVQRMGFLLRKHIEDTQFGTDKHHQLLSLVVPVFLKLGLHHITKHLLLTLLSGRTWSSSVKKCSSKGIITPGHWTDKTCKYDLFCEGFFCVCSLLPFFAAFNASNPLHYEVKCKVYPTKIIWYFYLLCRLWVKT